MFTEALFLRMCLRQEDWLPPSLSQFFVLKSLLLSRSHQNHLNIQHSDPVLEGVTKCQLSNYRLPIPPSVTFLKFNFLGSCGRYSS